VNALIMLAADLSAAMLGPIYSRPNAEVFGAARGQVGLRTSRECAGVLGLALRGLSDAEQARLALEPELLYAAASGGTFALGLSIVLWSVGPNAMGSSTWLGLELRITP
jgi:hypothetical protein